MLYNWQERLYSEGGINLLFHVAYTSTKLMYNFPRFIKHAPTFVLYAIMNVFNVMKCYINSLCIDPAKYSLHMYMYLFISKVCDPTAKVHTRQYFDY